MNRTLKINIAETANRLIGLLEYCDDAEFVDFIIEKVNYCEPLSDEDLTDLRYN